MDTVPANDLEIWQRWHIPLAVDDMCLGDAWADMRAAGDTQTDIPLMVQLVENPRFRLPGLAIFHGAVDLLDHDCIHILLGRGMMAKDEAFTIGFTMGSTHRVTTAEETLYDWIARTLYPGKFRFTDEDMEVFRDALRLGYISRCSALDRVAFRDRWDDTLGDLRADLGLETDLLRAYYRIEAARYPHCPESARLLNARPAA